MLKFLKDLFTGKDNQTWDLGRILWFAVVVVYLASTIIIVSVSHTLQWETWAAAAAAVLAGGGGALALKAKTEPDPQ